MANGNGRPDSSDRLERLERAQEIQDEQISELTKNVSSLTSSVHAMAEQQRALFGRADRPYPWGAIIGAVTLIGVCAGLLIAPIQQRLTSQEEFDTYMMQTLVKDAEQQGRHDENIRWLEKLEERTNDRMHRGIGN